MDGLTFASKLMDAFTNLVDALAWPIVALVLFVLLRPRLVNLIELIETVTYKGAEVRFRGVERAPGDTAPRAKNLLEQFWRPGSQRNLENEAKLRAWMRSEGIAVSITAFLNAEHLDATRRKAVEELKLDQPSTGGDGDGKGD